MTLKQQEIAAVIEELSVLAGARIQRVDLIKLDLIVFEIRCPKKTLRLLISGEPGLGRIHLVGKRPPKPTPPPNLQGVFRKWLQGQPILRLSSDGSQVVMDCPRTRFVAKIRGGKEVFSVSPQSHDGELPKNSLPERFVLSESIAANYADKSESQTENVLRQHLLRAVRSQLKKTRRLLANLENDALRLTKLQKNREYGELLKPHLGRLTRGQATLETFDWNGQPVKIPLDPSLGPKTNLETFFRKAKKAARGLPRVAERIQTVRLRVDELENRRTQITEMSPDELIAAEAQPRTQTTKLSAKSRPRKEKDNRLRYFETVDGHDVLVGKGAKENDYLTLKVAKGHDLWLHARGCPGAHVVLRLQKNHEASVEALLDAGHLAAFYSDRKKDSHVEILYTKAKFVRKTKGAAPGAVSVAKEKTINLRVEPQRLDRLLGRGE